MNELRAEVRGSPVVKVDETGWKSHSTANCRFQKFTAAFEEMKHTLLMTGLCEFVVRRVAVVDQSEMDPGYRTTGAESLSGFGGRRNGSVEAVVDFPGRAEIQ